MVSNADHRSIESEDDGPAAGLIAHALDCIFYSYKCRITDGNALKALIGKEITIFQFYSVIMTANDISSYDFRR